MEIPDGTETTENLPAHNETIATPKAESPPSLLTLRELVTSQPSEPAAEQPLMEQPVVAEEPPAAVTARDSAAPEGEGIQIAAVTAPKDGAENNAI